MTGDVAHTALISGSCVRDRGATTRLWCAVPSLPTIADSAASSGEDVALLLSGAAYPAQTHCCARLSSDGSGGCPIFDVPSRIMRMMNPAAPFLARVLIEPIRFAALEAMFFLGLRCRAFLWIHDDEGRDSIDLVPLMGVTAAARVGDR